MKQNILPITPHFEFNILQYENKNYAHADSSATKPSFCPKNNTTAAACPTWGTIAYQEA